MVGLIKRYFQIAIGIFVLFKSGDYYLEVVEGRTPVRTLSIFWALAVSLMLMLMIYGPAFGKTLFRYQAWWHQDKRMPTLLELWRQDFSKVDKDAWKDKGIFDISVIFWFLFKAALFLGFIGLALWIVISVLRWMWEHAIGF